ncbi:predicted protein [Pyrenophora tritici-repentis Pt-1C-BFP]|uniref:Uncharacterized protein n=1 Tax=Pyrenophora tritici-repentis (strain Pt-1C-BFP) TaxID=426418 RepID=B2WE75_PYRTR|nr:uncharacterized protein PTRG_08448 [Pyrenophora tritici-repentis Pt-1C-BFP]EDU51367.1 predicted protein [Pyrenophora tritici-repentis Pt-1C-BFP]
MVNGVLGIIGMFPPLLAESLGRCAVQLELRGAWAKLKFDAAWCLAWLPGVPGCAVVRLSHGPLHHQSGQPFHLWLSERGPVGVAFSGSATPFIAIVPYTAYAVGLRVPWNCRPGREAVGPEVAEWAPGD